MRWLIISDTSEFYVCQVGWVAGNTTAQTVAIHLHPSECHSWPGELGILMPPTQDCSAAEMTQCGYCLLHAVGVNSTEIHVIVIRCMTLRSPLLSWSCTVGWPVKLFLCNILRKWGDWSEDTAEWMKSQVTLYCMRRHTLLPAASPNNNNNNNNSNSNEKTTWGTGCYGPGPTLAA